jgi:4-hydroxybenzoate polyprenyltransferase
MNTLRRILFALETSKTSLGLWMVAFLCLIFSRLLVEWWLFGFEQRSALFLWYEFTHNFLFFSLSFLLFLPIFQYFARVSLSVASNMLLFGFLVILSPPIIDFLVSNGKGLWSFYIFDGISGLVFRYFTFFGDRPDMGITYGVRVEVALVTVFFGTCVFLKTRKYLRALCAGLSAYSLLFFLGTFPSWAAMVILGVPDGQWLLRAPDVAGVFLSPLSFFSRDLVDPRSILNVKMSLVYAALLPLVTGAWLFWYHRSVFLALFRNARLPQAIYHAGLLFVGMGLAVIFAHPKLSLGLFDLLAIILLVVAVVSAWLASVVPNDIFDQSIDEKTNPTRPLPSGAIPRPIFVAIGGGFFVISLLFSALVSMKGALLLLLYQAVAWGYSSPPFRLKRFPIVASSVSAVASVLILFLGFTTLSPDGTLATLPTSLVFLFLFAYMVSIPLKDFKDIEGDAKDSVWTVPVVLGVECAKLAIGAGIFLSYLASVFVFRAPTLFVPALLCGGASFWLVSLMREKTGRVTYRSVFWWILGFAAIYGFWVVGILF